MIVKNLISIFFVLYYVDVFAGGLIVSTDSIPQVWIDSAGRLGIGTHAPEDKLHLQGDFRLNGKLILNGFPGDSGAVLISRGAGNTPLWDSEFRKGLWEELDNKIRYSNKNVEVQKSLIQYGNIEASDDQSYYTKWMPNIPGGSDVPPFNFAGGRSVNGTGQPDNYVFNFGPNMNTGGGPYETGKSAFGLSFEYRFFIDNVPYNEFHILHVDEAATKQRRPVYCLFAHDASRMSWTHQLSDWNLHDKDNTKQVFSINTQQETAVYNGNTANQFRHIFSNTNYQPIWQKDETGYIKPLIGYVGEYLQLGNPTGNTLLKIGQNLEVGNAGEFDYIGSAQGNGITNFRIGSPGHKYNTIWHHTNSDINTRFATLLNAQGWGIGLNQQGAFYLHDFNSGTNPFFLSGSAPAHSFRMAPSGNIALGSTDSTEKLVVNGNLKIVGAILLNTQAGLPGQSITSQGQGQANTWEYTVKSRHELTFTAIENQTSFIIDYNVADPVDSKLPVEVFRNGIKLRFVTASPTGRQFTYSDNEIITSPCTAGDEIEIIYFKH